MPTNRETFFNLLKENNKYLTRYVIKTLLNDTNGFVGDTELYKNFDKNVQNYDIFLEKVNKIRNGEPFQYVLGYANFLDRNFAVNKDCLIPRQETEELVITVKSLIEVMFKDKPDITIFDVCTGSGCIGITLKRYFPNASVFASDISQKCIDIAFSNQKEFKVNFLLGNMLEPYIKNNLKCDVLVCNPPYIQDKKTIDEQVWKYEPHLALLADPKTKYYEEIFKVANKVIEEKFILAFEIGEDMGKELMDLAKNYFPTAIINVNKDMYNKDRFLYIIGTGENNNA